MGLRILALATIMGFTLIGCSPKENLFRLYGNADPSFCAITLDERCVDTTPAEIANEFVERSSEARVAMFGDYHNAFAPDEVIFSEYIMPKMYKQGFHDLALEFNSEHQDLISYMVDHKLDRRNIMYNLSGLGYTNLDPQNMSRVLHTAGVLGMEVHAIGEGKVATMTQRDQEIANLAYERVLQNADKKLLFFFGASHLCENNDNRCAEGQETSEKSLGQHLNEMTSSSVYTAMLIPANKSEYDSGNFQKKWSNAIAEGVTDQLVLYSAPATVKLFYHPIDHYKEPVEQH